MDSSERDRLLKELKESGCVARPGLSVGHSFISLFPSLPFEVCIPIPFTRMSIQFGGRNLMSCRKKVLRHPTNAQSHISLAALLLSQEPMTREYAQEAKDELLTALQLLPKDTTSKDYYVQERAMVHKFLGDALLELEEVEEARIHWKYALELDPVRPPFGFSGPALEQLEKHPIL